MNLAIVPVFLIGLLATGDDPKKRSGQVPGHVGHG